MKPRFSHDLVRGAPINVGGRVFVPEARVTTLSAREAVFSERAVSAMGFVIRRVMPTALIEQTPGGERRYVVEDATGRTLWAMASAALLAPLVLSKLANVISTRNAKNRR